MFVALGWSFLLWLGIERANIIQGGSQSKLGWERFDRTSFKDPLTDEASRSFLRTAFLKDPLSPRPFAISLAKVTAANPGMDEKRRNLAAHIVRIAPRHVLARLTLAELDFREGFYDKTASGVSKLIELDPKNTNSFLDVFVAMSARPKSRPAVEKILSERPTWGASLIMKLGKEEPDTDYLVRLSRDYPSSQSTIINDLIARGDLRRAHTAFFDFLDQNAREAATIPYDNRFNDLPGAEPFNWRVNSSLANFERRGGLSITFFGQGRPLIAEQIINLSPGAYSFSFTMQGDIYRGGGNFAWSIKCMESDDDLLALSIEQLTSVLDHFKAEFNVPRHNCGFQRLRISGVAGEFPRTTRATITEAKIEATGPANAR